MRTIVVLVIGVLAFIALVDFLVAVRQKRLNQHLQSEIDLLVEDSKAKDVALRVARAEVTMLHERLDEADRALEVMAKASGYTVPEREPDEPDSTAGDDDDKSADKTPVATSKPSPRQPDRSRPSTRIARQAPAGLPEEAMFLYTDEFFTNPSMHAAADAFAEYVIMHRRMLSEARSGNGKNARFVVLQPQAQSGNRLLGMSSAFVYALLSGRALVVNYGRDFYARLDDLFINPGFEWEADVPGGLGGRSESINFAEPVFNPRVTELLLCKNISEEMQDASVLQFTSHQFFAQMLHQNPTHRAELDRLFAGEAPGQIFRIVSRFLFRPNAAVMKIVTDFAGQHFAGKPTLGLQIRSVGFNGVPMFDKEYDVFYENALKLSPPGTVWFVATDTGESQQYVKKRWAQSGHEIVFIPHVRSNNPDGVRLAMADLVLLGLCDDLIITSYSTYGNVAAAWSITGKPPMIVTDSREPGEGVVSYGRFPEGHRREMPQDRDAPMYMNVPQASERRLWCFRLPHVEPCHHYYGIWRPDRASCFEQSMITEEMEGGRYC